MMHDEWKKGRRNGHAKWSVEVESWIEMSIGIFVFLIRYIVRIRLVGVRSFRGDDYCGLFSLVSLHLLNLLKTQDGFADYVEFTGLVYRCFCHESFQWWDMAACSWSLEVVVVQRLTIFSWTAIYGSFNGLSKQQIEDLDAHQISDLEFGSKCFFIGWVAYVCVVWGAKACVVFYYHSFT